MATITEVQQRASTNLKTIELMLADLPEIAAEWDEIDSMEREGWSLDWGNEMAGVRLLAEYAAEGILDADQQARYQQLLGKLRQALPTIDRLSIRRPMIPLDA